MNSKFDPYTTVSTGIETIIRAAGMPDGEAVSGGEGGEIARRPYLKQFSGNLHTPSPDGGGN